MSEQPKKSWAPVYAVSVNGGPVKPLGHKHTKTNGPGHQDCDICHPELEANRARAKRAALLDQDDDGFMDCGIADPGNPTAIAMMVVLTATGGDK